MLYTAQKLSTFAILLVHDWLRTELKPQCRDYCTYTLDNKKCTVGLVYFRIKDISMTEIVNLPTSK